jgi:hypothetical protein
LASPKTWLTVYPLTKASPETIVSFDQDPRSGIIEHRDQWWPHGTAQNRRGVVSRRNNILGAPSFSPYRRSCG